MSLTPTEQNKDENILCSLSSCLEMLQCWVWVPWAAEDHTASPRLPHKAAFCLGFESCIDFQQGISLLKPPSRANPVLWDVQLNLCRGNTITWIEQSDWCVGSWNWCSSGIISLGTGGKKHSKEFLRWVLPSEGPVPAGFEHTEIADLKLLQRIE